MGSIADWNPARTVFIYRASRANGPRRVYFPHAYCPIKGRPVDPGATAVGCVEDCGQYSDAGCSGWCSDCYRMWYAPCPF